jgi:hypothetical protein
VKSLLALFTHLSCPRKVGVVHICRSAVSLPTLDSQGHLEAGVAVQQGQGRLCYSDGSSITGVGIDFSLLHRSNHPLPQLTWKLPGMFCYRCVTTQAKSSLAVLPDALVLPEQMFF